MAASHYAAAVTVTLDHCLRPGAMHLCRLGRHAAGAAGGAAPTGSAVYAAGGLRDRDLAELFGRQQCAEFALVACAGAGAGYRAEWAGLAARRAPAPACGAARARGGAGTVRADVADRRAACAALRL